MAAEPIQLHSTAAAATAKADTGCACGHHEDEALVLDTRQIPHAIRHATIFGALDSLAVGISLDLVANHNPLPLLAQLAQRHPDAFETAYIDDGPELWTLRLTRVAA
ncbi:uncharacterized protein (DUF2249 family) [Homoserinimonas aerilata]|uniref:Uncharacterized protein (DUF2249 family) n=1 Tax=Homoserinimonas aerilata TaxID=1162970 RepID=A0A542YAR7_9MICO|nr:DUF2249 domain-containing protein [Homoserinimonas aerilata]TQL45054.1 uncharacterized protein (DUF2249 family) [Homoserinimonas aerilata]